MVIGKWVTQKEVKLMIMDEPTQGIDVGVKYELYVLMRKLVEEKKIGIIFISSEMPELLGICDRIYSFKGGTITKEFCREEFNREKILSYAL